MKIKGFKTVAFGATIVTLGGLESSGFTEFLSANAGEYTGIIGIAIVILRAFTNSSIFNK